MALDRAPALVTGSQGLGNYRVTLPVLHSWSKMKKKKIDRAAVLKTNPTSTSSSTLKIKKKNMTSETYDLTYDTWHLTCDIWHIKQELLHICCIEWFSQHFGCISVSIYLVSITGVYRCFTALISPSYALCRGLSSHSLYTMILHIFRTLKDCGWWLSIP